MNTVCAFETPKWVADAIFYQIFPERFANGNPGNDPPGSVPWGSEPGPDTFMGGDLEGVRQHLDYLVELGVNAIYFNPIFAARSNHKYDHGDYMTVDPHFGTNEEMKALVDEAHRRGIRIILDISQNHCGREFFAFADVVEKGAASPYKDWYHFESFPVAGPDRPNYECWWGIGTLPEFNHEHPEVRAYFNKVTRYWMEEVGIDGWRLDVANEVPHEYWRLWRRLVKGIDPQAYIVGEIWGDGSPWLQGDNFDAVMNYVWRDHLLDFFIEQSLSPSEFHRALSELLRRHPTTVSQAMFNLLGSHDTPRILTLAKGNRDKVKLAFLFQMTYPGAPVIYYGDEIGMKGGKDPECRGAFPWEQSAWDLDLRAHVKRLIELRKSLPALRSVEYEGVVMDDVRGVYGFRRGVGRESVYVAVNNSEKPHEVILPVWAWNGARKCEELLSGTRYPLKEAEVSIHLAPLSGAILQPVP